MQDLMIVTGLEKGGIYRHFPAKQEIALEAFHYAVNKAITERLERADQETAPLSRVRVMINSFIERPSPVAGGCPVMNLGSGSTDTNPELRVLALRSLESWKQWIMAALAAAKDSGNIPPKTDSRKLANQIVATLEGALLISKLEKNSTGLYDAVDGLKCVLDDLEARSAEVRPLA